MVELKFMIVDDTAPYRQILSELVQGHRKWRVIVEAEDGGSAVTLAEWLKPEIILMDVNMPGMNGIEATRKLKQIDPDVRVVLFSGYRYRTLEDASNHAGADAFFWKEDLEETVLEELVERWFPPEQ